MNSIESILPNTLRSTLQYSALTSVVHSVADKCCIKWNTYVNHLVEVTFANLLAIPAKLKLTKLTHFVPSLCPLFTPFSTPCGNSNCYTSTIAAGASAFWLNSWYVNFIVILPYIHSIASCSSCNEILLARYATFFVRSRVYGIDEFPLVIKIRVLMT